MNSSWPKGKEVCSVQDSSAKVWREEMGNFHELRMDESRILRWESGGRRRVAGSEIGGVSLGQYQGRGS